MNSILQCLLVTPYLSEFFMGGEFKATVQKVQRPQVISKAFYYLIHKVNSANEQIIPSEVKSAISRRNH